MQRAKEFKGLKVPQGGIKCERVSINICDGMDCLTCLFSNKNFESHVQWYLEHDLTKITQPFGLLSKETQDRLKKVWNEKTYGSNIQICYGQGWATVDPDWAIKLTYRLDPNWKPEEVKKITKEELWKIAEEKIGKFEVVE